MAIHILDRPFLSFKWGEGWAKNPSPIFFNSKTPDTYRAESKPNETTRNPSMLDFFVSTTRAKVTILAVRRSLVEITSAVVMHIVDRPD